MCDISNSSGLRTTYGFRCLMNRLRCWRGRIMPSRRRIFYFLFYLDGVALSVTFALTFSRIIRNAQFPRFDQFAATYSRLVRIGDSSLDY